MVHKQMKRCSSPLAEGNVVKGNNTKISPYTCLEYWNETCTHKATQRFWQQCEATGTTSCFDHLVPCLFFLEAPVVTLKFGCACME